MKIVPRIHANIVTLYLQRSLRSLCIYDEMVVTVWAIFITNNKVKQLSLFLDHASEPLILPKVIIVPFIELRCVFAETFFAFLAGERLNNQQNWISETIRTWYEKRRERGTSPLLIGRNSPYQMFAIKGGSPAPCDNRHNRTIFDLVSSLMRKCNEPGCWMMDVYDVQHGDRIATWALRICLLHRY